MSRRACPPWCLPSPHNVDTDAHMSAPVVVTTPAERFVLHVESYGDRLPFLSVAQFLDPMDETDVPSFEPDNFLTLPLPVAADLAAGIASLIAVALGGAR